MVCLIDSGVDPNPDTTPILVGSDALQAGTDTNDELSKLSPRVQPGNHPDGHGTYMAMIMAAPVNGWGMAGIAPTSVRVYSVKAVGCGQPSSHSPATRTPIVHCMTGPGGVSRYLSREPEFGISGTSQIVGLDGSRTPRRCCHTHTART